jgi:hypothetical protein
MSTDTRAVLGGGGNLRKREALMSAPVVRIAMLAMGILLSGCASAVAQNISRTFLCEGIQGFYIGAPEWRPNPDGYSNTSFLISYKSGSGVLSHVTSFYNGAKAYEADGLGISMNTGFSVAIFSDEYTETYVVNVNTFEPCIPTFAQAAGCFRMP